MDVEMQMEANGLPSQFGSTSDAPSESHVTSNMAASISNAETTPTPSTDLKQTVTPAPTQIQSSAPEPDLPSLAEPVQAPNGVLHRGDAPGHNHIFEGRAALENILPAVPDSQPKPIFEASLPSAQPDPAIFSTSASSLADSMVPSSIPVEVEVSETSVQISQPSLESATEPIFLQPQAPTSDLRSSPHADELTPVEVAQVEAQKHKEDNEAAYSIPVAEPTSVEPILSQAPIASMSTETSFPKLANTGLATPPAQSPPPAPQPAPAILPTELSVESTEHAPPPLLQELPVEPAPTPVVPAPIVDTREDQLMTDVSSPPTKLVREREEDEDVEPAAKRTKTDEGRQGSEQTDFKIPQVPAAASPSLTNGTPPSAANGTSDGNESITAPRLAHMKKIISNLKKSNASQAFRLPVDYVVLNILSYPEIVKNPMDLGTLDTRLKQGAYTRVSDFVQDFELIVNNCVAFNGAEHAVTQQAFKMQNSFNNQMANLPAAAAQEPSKEQKRAARLKQEPTRQAPPRRPSISTSVPPVAPARSPKAAPATPSFAVGPDGVPLIRRDSNMADGRPKRAIVPTKRNSEFSGGRPKKKKNELQLRFCQEVLTEISSPKNWQMNQYFTHPVDPVALNIPTYFQIIKKPMDLGTVKTKLDNNVYEKAREFEEDVRLIFKNCFKFNPDNDYVNQCGHQLEELFDKRWATKDEWIAAREPASEPQSDVDDDDEEDDDSEDAEADSEDDRNDKIIALQKQIEMMSKQMGELTQPKKTKKKSKSPTVAAKKHKKSVKREKQANAMFPNLKKSDKPKKSSGSRPKSEKDRYVTFAEKQYISNGIAMLPEKQMQEALKIIQQSVPSLAQSDQNEIELDIEEVPNYALLKLLSFVKKYAGPPPDEPKAEVEGFGGPATAKSSKKNKPMSKVEQEAQIEELKGKLGAYAGPISPNTMQSIENAEDSSDDDGDSEESEEE